jgi:hypothetical protein
MIRTISPLNIQTSANNPMIPQQDMQKWAELPHLIIPIYLNNPKRPLWSASSNGYLAAIKNNLGGTNMGLSQQQLPNLGSDAAPENWSTFRRLYQFVLPWGCKITIKVKEVWIANATALYYADANNNLRWNVSSQDPCLVGIIHQREQLTSQNPIQINPQTTMNQVTQNLQMSELHLVDAWTVKPVDFDSIWIQNNWIRTPGQVTESSARHSVTLSTKYIKFYNLLKTLQPWATKATYKDSNQWAIPTNSDIAPQNALLAFFIVHFRPLLDASSPIPANSGNFFITYGIRFKIRIRYWLEFYQKIPYDRIALSRLPNITDTNTYEPWTLKTQAFYDANYPELDPTANATVWSIRKTYLQNL